MLTLAIAQDCLAGEAPQRLNKHFGSGSLILMEDKSYESEFLQLVLGLQSSAWMLLGKIANPISGKQEKNLEAAKGIIDTLIMLKEKTRGNLSKTEESLLGSAIQQLEVNYVDEMSKEQSGQQEPPMSSEPETGTATDTKTDIKKSRSKKTGQKKSS